jgi:hypothetical protein
MLLPMLYAVQNIVHSNRIWSAGPVLDNADLVFSYLARARNNEVDREWGGLPSRAGNLLSLRIREELLHTEE